mgnify:CR=1 FL=1
MARTILEIAIEAAERDATAPAPTTLFGTGNRTAKVLRTAAFDTMREYLTRTNWIGSSEFHSSWVFSTIPNRFAYPMPPDYLRMIPNTEHRGGWPLGLVGPASPQSWAQWLFGGSASPLQAGWRISNNALWIDPTPKGYELITINYVSLYPVVSLIEEGDYDMSGDRPTCVAPFVPRDGHINLPTQLDVTPDDGDAIYEGPPGWDTAVYGTEPSEALKRLNPASAVDPKPEVRRPNFTADTDRPAFQDDHLLSLGMTFRLRRALGLDYAEAAGEYEDAMEAKITSDAGGMRTFQIGRRDETPSVAPLGNGRWMVS